MRIVQLGFLLIAAGVFATAAKADPLTVGQLMARCGKLDLSEYNQVKLRSDSVGDALDAGKCWGHLEAYLDIASVEFPDANTPNAAHPLGACPPHNTINFTLVAQLFLRYGETHPADLQKPAALIVAELLAQRFPCHR
jgi:hypothetical protein